VAERDVITPGAVDARLKMCADCRTKPRSHGSAEDAKVKLTELAQILGPASGLQSGFPVKMPGRFESIGPLYMIQPLVELYEGCMVVLKVS
jgi:hypothetical protein